MMLDYLPKSVNQHHEIMKRCFGGRKKDPIYMCVCIAE